MDITQERLFLLSREGGIPASVQIIDVEEGPVTGTKIILHLPLNTLY